MHAVSSAFDGPSGPDNACIKAQTSDKAKANVNKSAENRHKRVNSEWSMAGEREQTKVDYATTIDYDYLHFDSR